MARYENTRRVGSGGFGVVWEVKRSSDDQLFAKKELAVEGDSDAISRFIREVRIQSSLRHPNIIKVIGKRLTRSPYFYIMPLYDRSLFEELDSIVGEEERIYNVFEAVLEAVAYAHDQGVIHRDLKPENVLMDSDADVVVSDFGLGRIVDALSTRLTRSGDRFGTALYCAPEQVRSPKSAGPPADVFSLGRMLYELYAGELTTAVQDLSELPANVSLIVERATKRDPNDRFSDAGEMLSVFRSLCGGEMDDSHESLNKLVGKITVVNQATEDDLDQLSQILASVSSNEDAIHSAVMSLPPQVFAQLADGYDSVARSVIKTFCNQLNRQSWGFDYTDSIGSVCENLFDSIRHAEIKVALLVSVLFVGVGHNRWAVMKTFGRMLANANGSAEARRFAAELAEYPRQLDHVSSYVELNNLHPVLISIFEEKE